MNIENMQTQMHKGVLEFCVLHLLSRGESYTNNLHKDIRAAGFSVVEGTLYPLLSRLCRQGHVRYRWDESPLGPPRKYYALEASGRAMLVTLAKAWTALRQSIDNIVSKQKLTRT